MTSVFKPKTPKIPDAPVSEPEEEIQVIKEEAGAAQRREKKKLLRGGRRSTIISGITSALKKRLGE